MTRPRESEYAPEYRSYVELVPGADALAALDAELTEIRRLPSRVPPEKERFAYAPGKWSVRQLVGHLIDSERAFGFRAFCFSRGEKASIPGFDEDPYVARSTYGERSLSDLAEELAELRSANLRMLRNVREEDWNNAGTANGARITVRALAFVMAGHFRHHRNVLRDRYGIPDGR